MENVKLFSIGFGGDQDLEPLIQLEIEINQWLWQNSKVNIVDRQMSSSSGNHPNGAVFINCTVAIFYSEPTTQ